MKNLDKIYNLLERIDIQYRDYTLLTESQESKSISAAKKLVMQKLGWDEQPADELVRRKIRNDLPALRTRNGGKFILGVTRMFLDEQLNDGTTILRLNQTIELVASDAHINEYDRNLNGLSAQELIDRFAGNIKELGDRDREENAALELQVNNDYTIVQIDDFEQAKQYSQYTSWCITHNSGMINSYTSGGIGQFYFCLKNGFENIPEEPGENSPLDEYGLSMVAVSVDGDGNLNTCTCRWNHDYGGNDHIMDTKQISQLIGRNFYEVFKPNNKWEKTIEDVLQRLANGEDPHKIFDRVYENTDCDYKVVRLFNSKFNVISDKNELISDKWYDHIEYKGSYNGEYYWSVTRKSDYLSNIINSNGQMISPNLWFEQIYRVSDGFFLIYVPDKKYNYLRTDGKILSPDRWFVSAQKFIDGFAKVSLSYTSEHGFAEICLINKEGKIITKQPFQQINNFSEGFALVSIFGKGINYIDTNGDLISDEWFDGGWAFEDGVAKVRIEAKFNLLNKDGHLICKENYNEIGTFGDGWVDIRKGNKYNFVNNEGEILFPNMWFDAIYTYHYNDSAFHDGKAYVRIGTQWHTAFTDGTLIKNDN